MFAFATCVGSPEVFSRVCAPALRRVAEPDAVVIETEADAGSIHLAYDEVLEHVAGMEGVEALVLLHEDVELRDPDFCDRVRRRFAASPDCAVLGAVGARGVRSLSWWEWDGRGRAAETRGVVDFGGEPGPVDVLDGLLLVLSPWAVANLRCVPEEYPGFHGYDAELCAQARAAGKEVWWDRFDLFHHTKGGFGDAEAFARADAAWRRRWVGAPAA